MFDSRIVTIKSVEYDKKDRRNGRIELETDDGFWVGMKRKDMYRKNNDEKYWDKYLIKANRLKLFTHGWSTVVGAQIETDVGWEDAWVANNDFSTFEEDEISDKAYDEYCKKEGKLVKKLIEKEKTLKEIESTMDGGHSVFTHSWAMGWGITNAKNKDYANKIKAEWNKESGGTGKEKGTINRAILQIEVKNEN